MENPRVLFGKAVRRYRLRLGVSQEELAGRAGMDRSYIGQVERGETNISLLNLLRLAKALQIGPDKLVKNLKM